LGQQNKRQALFNRQSKHKTSVSCLYINKLDDTDLNILEKMILASVTDMQCLYEITMTPTLLKCLGAYWKTLCFLEQNLNYFLLIYQ
jgi:hypothetical protein